MSYPITQDFIKKGPARGGIKLQKIRFLVSHDTGNPGSTAKQNRDYFDRVQPEASAHVFIDDKTILEVIPLDEKAWHVRYNVTEDARLFGVKANDAAIGIELAWGGVINFIAAYQRYVWFHAHLCQQYQLDPSKDIVAHSRLDPTRRSDPENALKRYGKSWTSFIKDVITIFHKLEGNPAPIPKTILPSGLLKKGSTGEQVKQLQSALNQMALSQLSVDGRFGPKTEAAVRHFQQDHPPLIADGIYGPQTQAALSLALNGRH